MERKRYTSEDDSTIIRYVQENPNNLSRAFRLAAGNLHRTTGGCKERWYRTLKEGDPCFTVVSGKKYSINSKSAKKTRRIRLKIWGKIASLLFKK